MRVCFSQLAGVWVRQAAIAISQVEAKDTVKRNKKASWKTEAQESPDNKELPGPKHQILEKY